MAYTYGKGLKKIPKLGKPIFSRFGNIFEWPSSLRASNYTQRINSAFSCGRSATFSEQSPGLEIGVIRDG